jgi:hypothetical protein
VLGFYWVFLDSIRNHAILSIVPEECYVYQTKERCPFYLCVELFRPEEISRQQEFDQLYESKKPLKEIKQKQLNYLKLDMKISYAITTLD